MIISSVKQILAGRPLPAVAPCVTVREAWCCLADALALMKAGNFRHVPVVENGRTVGLLSIRDIPTEYRLMRERFDQYRATPCAQASAETPVRRAAPRPAPAGAALPA